MKALSVKPLSNRTASLLILVAWGTLSAPPLYAQDDALDNETALEEGVWALLFQVGPDVSLSSFDGATVSAKKHLAADRALRFGVTASVDFSSDEEELNREEGQQENEVTTETDRNRQFFAVSGQYLKYAFVDRPITLYYGAGPEVGFSRLSQEMSLDQARERTATRTAIEVGVLGVLGAEWFVRSDLSLSAEYRSALYVERSSDEAENSDGTDAVRQERRRVSYGLSPRGVRAGLSLYF